MYVFVNECLCFLTAQVCECVYVYVCVLQLGFQAPPCLEWSWTQRVCGGSGCVAPSLGPVVTMTTISSGAGERGTHSSLSFYIHSHTHTHILTASLSLSLVCVHVHRYFGLQMALKILGMILLALAGWRVQKEKGYNLEKKGPVAV